MFIVTNTIGIGQWHAVANTERHGCQPQPIVHGIKREDKPD